MTTETVSVVVEAALGLVLGLVIALFINWKMTLITTALTPIMIIGVIAMSRL